MGTATRREIGLWRTLSCLLFESQTRQLGRVYSHKMSVRDINKTVVNAHASMLVSVKL